MTAKEFLIDTIKFYGEDPSGRRSTTGRTCRYRDDKGRKCAVGRFIPDDQYDPGMEDAVANSPSVIAHLSPEVAHFMPAFLRDVQKLHDAKFHWGAQRGLSSAGRSAVQWICKDWDIPYAEVEVELEKHGLTPEAQTAK